MASSAVAGGVPFSCGDEKGRCLYIRAGLLPMHFPQEEKRWPGSWKEGVGENWKVNVNSYKLMTYRIY